MGNKVSIALCTYNGDKFLREQLDSILNQTYQDFELIIVDDGSSDFTIQIVLEYMNKSNKISLYQNENNIGFIKNFEKAISLCSGDYIFLADQDDIWLSNKIEFFLKEIKNNVLIYSDAILIDREGNSKNEMLIYPKNLISGSNNKAFLFDNCISGNTMMFKKELINYILPIPDNISFHDVWIAFVASTYGKITYTKTPLTLYRRYSEQITSVNKKEYKNFFHRFKEKKAQKIKYSIKHLNNLRAFSQLSILKDEELIKIINQSIYHFQNYPKIFYNKNLHSLLRKYKNDIFAIQDSKKRDKLVFKLSLGLKVSTTLMFII